MQQQVLSHNLLDYCSPNLCIELIYWSIIILLTELLFQDLMNFLLTLIFQVLYYFLNFILIPLLPYLLSFFYTLIDPLMWYYFQFPLLIIKFIMALDLIHLSCSLIWIGRSLNHLSYIQIHLSNY